MQHQSVSLFYSIASFLLLYFCILVFCLVYVLSVESHLQSCLFSLTLNCASWLKLVHLNCDIDICSVYLHPLPLGGHYCLGYIAAFLIISWVIMYYVSFKQSVCLKKLYLHSLWFKKRECMARRAVLRGLQLILLCRKHHLWNNLKCIWQIFFYLLD